MAKEEQIPGSTNNFPHRAAPLDLDHLREQVSDDKELLREIVLLFFEETDTQMRQLKEAIAAQDYETSGRVAHSLKGSFSGLHAHIARLHAQDLELAVMKKQPEHLLRGMESIEADLLELRLHLEPLTLLGGN